jgi:hypothetical protein
MTCVEQGHLDACGLQRLWQRHPVAACVFHCHGVCTSHFWSLATCRRMSAVKEGEHLYAGGGTAFGSADIDAGSFGVDRIAPRMDKFLRAKPWLARVP